MYKFITIQGSCGSPYDIGKCEAQTNEMHGKGYSLVQAYQTTTPSCVGSGNSALVLVFKKND